MRLYNKDMVIHPKLRNFSASCWSKLDTEVTEVSLRHAYTFIRNCVIIRNHSWICTYVFLWNASPCQVLIIHRSKTLRCGLSSRYISTAWLQYKGKCILNDNKQMQLILYWRIYNRCSYSFTNSFPLCSTRRDLYICLNVIVHYYVIPVIISCKSSYGWNRNIERNYTLFLLDWN